MTMQQGNWNKQLAGCGRHFEFARELPIWQVAWHRPHIRRKTMHATLAVECLELLQHALNQLMVPTYAHGRL
eukprot:3065406-Amphidinium_carterae.1